MGTLSISERGARLVPVPPLSADSAALLRAQLRLSRRQREIAANRPRYRAPRHVSKIMRGILAGLEARRG